ncbi:MAG: DUF167 domain-containing protein [Rhodospirillaceae bacterium]|jgi:uncharacterized protein|nr:DUF167 domain-containing protein [Rhodospirillaceae bacterium]MBT4044598.1 DUF167 domain-containing protein [Rhodospirillaceae bacterium]MBT5081849.1 DUF167 domain-containing protein [Rhodospirillaceae bacterium]MBT5524913.1 DUF167 domain-containing protein [Rhodospirillaceae bacterium]MBT5881378.1 DUF167 domain-containing protein [Rhodospirillaceae bacterium]
MCCSPCCKAIAGSSGRRSLPFTTNSKGTLIAVRLRPGAAANRIDGVQDRVDGSRCLVVRVTAAPEKGKANQAMIKLLAKAWGVPRSSLSVMAGTKDRNKTILLENDKSDLSMLRAWRAAQSF